MTGLGRGETKQGTCQAEGIAGTEVQGQEAVWGSRNSPLFHFTGAQMPKVGTLLRAEAKEVSGPGHQGVG